MIFADSVAFQSRWKHDKWGFSDRMGYASNSEREGVVNNGEGVLALRANIRAPKPKQEEQEGKKKKTCESPVAGPTYKFQKDHSIM